MPNASPDDRSILDAGSLAAWLADTWAALRGERDADVPCGSCTACCRSSQFVHIAPDEHDALAHIPPELLFPAPRLPRGHVLMGYDDRGWCPMLTEAGCSIYEHRPRTCRTYDCRVFAATGIEPDADAPAVAEQARRWRFDLGTADDERRHRSLVGLADELRRLAGDPDRDGRAVVPRSPTGQAVLAVELDEQLDASTTPGEIDLVAILQARTARRGR